MPELVTVKTFMQRYEAELARSVLEAYGIWSLVRADDCGGMRPVYLLGGGGAGLVVQAEDVGAARQVLDADLPIPGRAPDLAGEDLPLPGEPGD
jgi:hypothetical protein